jgi:hypothetical protein
MEDRTLSPDTVMTELEKLLDGGKPERLRHSLRNQSGRDAYRQREMRVNATEGDGFVDFTDNEGLLFRMPKPAPEAARPNE